MTTDTSITDEKPILTGLIIAQQLIDAKLKPSELTAEQRRSLAQLVNSITATVESKSVRHPLTPKQADTLRRVGTALSAATITAAVGGGTGMAVGAAMGAGIGSVFPGLGTIFGAAAGAIVGGLMYHNSSAASPEGSGEQGGEPESPTKHAQKG
jgi:hypothetical protein